MSQKFFEYMSKRLIDINLEEEMKTNAPLITISRAAGCSINSIVTGLVKKLNELEGEKKWKYISKKILHDSAEELQLHPDEIKAILEPKNRNLFDEIVQTFLSSDYELEKKVRKTIINIIHRFGSEGYNVIVGRGANYICADINNSLHIRIDAPLKWKTEKICELKNITSTEAIEYIKETEKKRTEYRKYIKGKNLHPDDFDLTINQAVFSSNDIIELVVKALELKLQNE
jgi:cytidylate kinase